MMMGCVRPWLSGETGYVASREGAEQAFLNIWRVCGGDGGGVAWA